MRSKTGKRNQAGNKKQTQELSALAQVSEEVSNPLPAGNSHPISSDERAKLRAEIARWCFTPDPLKVPKTFAQLAKELGISRSYGHYLKRQIPSDLELYLQEGDVNALVRWPEVARELGDRAAGGNKDATALVSKLRETYGNRRKDRDEKPKTPESVTRAFMMLGVVKEQMALGNVTLDSQQLKSEVIAAPESSPNISPEETPRSESEALPANVLAE